MIFDHMGFNVRDFQASKAFYAKALAPLGIVIAHEKESFAMLGRPGRPQFWIGSMGKVPGPIHVAFAAESREQVRQFYQAAIAAGGKDNGAPGIRDYHPNYYGAFVLDLDGHNIEAVCHKPEG
jgi:predicted lactoylglutathione lyase